MSGLPYLTATLPGIGGDIKSRPEDFIVEEIPLYDPSGEGTHTYLRIEKHGLTTLDAVERIARALGKRPRDIGYAGLKDARAVTRQILSVEHVDPARIERLELPRIRVLWTDRHRNKLKLGHLSGNRFVLKIRDCVPEAVERAGAILEVLRERGVPNYFGPQRFGARGDNADVGVAVLRGDYDEALAVLLGRPGSMDRAEVRAARELFDEGRFAEAADVWPGSFRDPIRMCRVLSRSNGDARRGWTSLRHNIRRLHLSAAQSLLFNQVVSARLCNLDTLEVGDLAWKHDNGACFHVEDATVEQPRCDAFEVSPTGPLFGRRMTDARGRPGRAEADVLSAAGLDRGMFRRIDGVSLDGARRPLRVPLGEAAVEEGQDDRGRLLGLSFTLPPGSYATSVAREVCKSD